MLPKKNRADKKAVERIFKDCSFPSLGGRVVSSPFLTFKFILTKSTASPRISFIAPKSVAKLAVERNLLKRSGYSVLKKYINQFPLGTLGAFVFKKYQSDKVIIENEIKNILTKIN